MGIRRGWRWRQRRRNRPKTILEKPLKSKPRNTCAYIDETMHWYVAYVRPMSEKSVARKLESDGLTSREIITYLPIVNYEIDKQVRGRRFSIEVERALFASYLFVGMETPDLQFGAVKEMDGVIDLLSDETKEPIEIPASILRGIERDLAGPMPVKPASVLVPGCSVRITEGPFSSFLAVIQEILSEKHVRAILNCFGRQSLAELRVSQLEAA